MRKKLCNDCLVKGQMTMTYQELFNETLTKMRYATSGAVLNNEPLMRSLVKIMYDFSDELKKNKIIVERTNDDEQKNSKTV